MCGSCAATHRSLGAVNPGIAKLLGVLSLQSLPRRLALDFRDVFSDGFSFDFVRGDVTIAQGIARTNNLQMKGVNAAVLMEGQADIAKETQSIKVVVIPKINAGSASLIASGVAKIVLAFSMKAGSSWGMVVLAGIVTLLVGPPRAVRHPIAAKVAYHDACHLAHGQGVRAQPRALLQAIPGIEVVTAAEMNAEIRDALTTATRLDGRGVWPASFRSFWPDAPRDRKSVV